MDFKLQLPFKIKPRLTFSFGENPTWYLKLFGHPHQGVDYGMPVGTPIYAAADGIITLADCLADANGLGILLSHNFGITQYWHLSSVTAKETTKVASGQLIGYSGNTGYSTGPHLHFGLKDLRQESSNYRKWIDPIPFITGQPTIEPPAAPILKTYVVLPGDTLWKIATKFYGDGYSWRKIFLANQDKIKDPALIWPLQKLLIP